MKCSNKLALCIAAMTFAVSSVFAGSVSDKDGNKYKTVKIGNQHWMAEDYRYESRNSSCANFKDNPDNCIRTYRISEMKYEDRINICPSGWDLPTLEDIQELILFLEPDYYNLSPKQQRHAGQKMSNKLRSKSWNDGEDSFGFNAKPNAGASQYHGPTYAMFPAIENNTKLIELRIYDSTIGAYNYKDYNSDYHIRCIENKSNPKKDSKRSSTESLSKPFKLLDTRLP